MLADGQETEAIARLSLREADFDFQAAMKAAIKAGLENAPIGIFKDDSPISPTHFIRSQRASWCSSSAGLCADVGERHHGRFTDKYPVRGA
jgi:hypothetical protein